MLVRVFIIVIMTLALNMQTAFAEEKLTAFDFLKPASFSDVSLSPNGEFMAVSSVATERLCIDRKGQIARSSKKCKDKKKQYREVYGVNIFDIKNLKGVAVIPIPKNLVVDWVDWVNDDRLLVAVQRPFTYGNYDFSEGGARVVSFSRTTKKTVPLFSGRRRLGKQNRYLSRISNFLPDDPDHVLMPASLNDDLDLWKVNVNTGDAKVIGEGKMHTFHWQTDRAGRPVFRFDCKSERCKEIEVFGHKGQDEKWTLIKTFEVKPDQEQEMYEFFPIAPTDNPNHFIVYSNENDQARQTIRVYDVKTDTYVRTVFEDEKYDVSGAFINRNTGQYAGAWYLDDKINYKMVDPEFQEHLDFISKHFNNEKNIRLATMADEGRLILFAVDSPQNSGTYYLYNTETQKIEYLLERNKSLNAGMKSASKAMWIQMRDGTSIRAYHSYPANAQSVSDLPLIVMPHGGPEARDYLTYHPWVQYFVSRNYQVLQMDFRGSSGYGQQFTEAGYGEWGGVMHQDLTDTVKYFYDKGLSTPEQTCIVGYSYGGYAALYAGAKTPDMYKCIVSGGGLSDLLRDLKATKNDSGEDSANYEYWLKSIGDPKTDSAKLKAISPRNMAAQFKAPVLLFHGEYDEIVDVSQSRKMEKALKVANKNVTYIELKNALHNGWPLEYDIYFLEKTDQFIRESLQK